MRLAHALGYFKSVAHLLTPQERDHMYFHTQIGGCPQNVREFIEKYKALLKARTGE